jgi:hypothetical protein
MDSVTVPHATQHTNLNDAVEALQSKVGVDGSAVTTSLDYQLNDIGTWTSYTPVVTAQTGTVTSYISSGQYTRINNLVIYEYAITITNIGTATNSMRVSVPVAFTANTKPGAKGSFTEYSVAGFQGVAFNIGLPEMALLRYDWGTPFRNGGNASGFAVYEV